MSITISSLRQTAALFLVFAFPVVALAGGNAKRVVAARTPSAPIVDGRLGDAVWALAKPVMDFTQSEPIEGAPPTHPTSVRILYDDDALYIGGMLYDSSPKTIGRRLARRDEEIDADYLSVRFDSHHDHQTAYELTISAAGVKIDILQFNDGEQEDVSWDVVWEGVSDPFTPRSHATPPVLRRSIAFAPMPSGHSKASGVGGRVWVGPESTAASKGAVRPVLGLRSAGLLRAWQEAHKA